MKASKTCLFIAMIILFALQSSAQCPKSKFGIVPVWPQAWTSPDKENWYQELSDKGMGYCHIIWTWPQFEQIQNTGQLTTYKNYIAHLRNDFGFKFHLLLRNPSLSYNSVPSSYQGLNFNDTILTNALYDFSIQMIDSLGPVLDYLSIGGESDVYFESHSNELSPYVNLLENIANYVHSNHPSIKFATTLTLYHGILQNDTLWQLTKDFSDMLSVTYWPLNADFTISSTAIEDVPDVISDLLLAAGDKPIIIKESGLPSSSITNSSELLQANFVEELFNQTKNIDQIEIVGWDFLADYDRASIDYWVSFQQIYTQEFRSYIGSLGLMDTLGNPKPSYTKYLQMMDSVCLTANIQKSSIDNQIKIYPNPTTTTIFIDSDINCIIEIYSNTGQKIIETEQKSVDISFLKSSIYLIYARKKDGEILFMKKFIKQ